MIRNSRAIPRRESEQLAIGSETERETRTCIEAVLHYQQMREHSLPRTAYLLKTSKSKTA
jgi:hypothetical protein